MTDIKETMEDVMNEVKEVNIGDVVQGEVLTLDDQNQAVVSILGTGMEGVVPARELSASPGAAIEELIHVGDILDLVVIKSIGKDKENGSYVLSKRRLDAKKVWEEIEVDFQEGNLIEGTVVDYVKGGLVVDVGVRGFVPASMISDRYVSDFAQYKGQTLTFKIMEIEPSENRLILSRKAVIEAEKEAKVQALLEQLAEDAVVEGVVARLTDFGAFIDLGGVDGLVHISEIAHEHVADPADKLTVGENVSVKILSIDPEEGRISLSMKALQPAPWELVPERISVGDVLDGVIRRLTTFGAFVELYPGVEGLVHISQISRKHISTPHDVLTEGEEVTVKVLDVDAEQRRIGLSIKALDTQDEEVVVEEYDMPEEVTGFTMEEISDISEDETL